GMCCSSLKIKFLAWQHRGETYIHFATGCSPPPPGPCHHPTFLELLQHGVELGVVEDKVQRVVVEPGDGLEGRAVVRVHKSQVLNEEQVHDVGAVTLENGDAGVAALHDLGHGVEVKHGLGSDHEAVPERSHHVLHRLGAQLQGSLDDVELLLDQIVVRVSDPQHLQQLL
ncbi:hypothetical protein Anapl_17176, partial [Anas platyrhynchos]